MRLCVHRKTCCTHVVTVYPLTAALLTKLVVTSVRMVYMRHVLLRKGAHKTNLAAAASANGVPDGML